MCSACYVHIQRQFPPNGLCSDHDPRSQSNYNPSGTGTGTGTTQAARRRSSNFIPTNDRARKAGQSSHNHADAASIPGSYTDIHLLSDKIASCTTTNPLKLGVQVEIKLHYWTLGLRHTLQSLMQPICWHDRVKTFPLYWIQAIWVRSSCSCSDLALSR